MKHFSSFVPRGYARKKLERNGRIHNIRLNRTMSNEEVESSIKHICNGKEYIVLEVGSGGRLIKSEAALTAQAAIDRRGALYICEKGEENTYIYIANLN